ncbi:MAG: 30S ribosomal protein S3 [Nitrososphaerota archaeon]|nr:30S ribosomal protein S3 [Nitrososphaerota archaeon]MDG6939501.1 30S ribosomal protein S3 [Nitrososphaerota archaeon]
MPYGKLVVAKLYKSAELDEYLEEALKAAGYGGAELEKLPLGYRLNLFVVRPGLAIGRKGTGIRALTENLSQKFGLDNLTVNVEEITEPDMNPRVVAQRIASMAERGMAFRRAASITMNNVMRAGAMGCIIAVRGKLRSERSHFERYVNGVVPISGHQKDIVVRSAVSSVLLKMGLYGISVKISYKDAMPPEFELKKQEQPPPEGEKVQENVSAQA